MTQFKCDVDMLTTADSGPRDVSTILWGVFHTTENDDNTPPQNVARWQQDRKNNSSYNVLFGARGTTVRSNDDNYIPWAAGWTGNQYGLHGSAVGRAARTRSQWLQHPEQLESMAQWAADLNRRYGIPLIRLTVAGVQAKKRGFCGHLEISNAFKEVNHTDPGMGFPWDVVLNRAKEINTPVERKSNIVASQDKRLDLTLDQLVGHPWKEWPGWDQLGNRSLVDALGAIGEKLGVAGMFDTQGEQRKE